MSLFVAPASARIAACPRLDALCPMPRHLGHRPMLRATLRASGRG